MTMMLHMKKFGTPSYYFVFPIYGTIMYKFSLLIFRDAFPEILVRDNNL